MAATSSAIIFARARDLEAVAGIGGHERVPHVVGGEVRQVTGFDGHRVVVDARVEDDADGCAVLRERRETGEHGVVPEDEAAHEGAPRQRDRDLVGDRVQFGRRLLDAADGEDDVGDAALAGLLRRLR